MRHASFLDRRRAGVLLHPTSLPGCAGWGDLGPEAYRFVDFLVETGFTIWQMLPLAPTHADGSPYLCLSVHAGNPRLISLELLIKWEWLEREACARNKKITVDHHSRCLRQARREFSQHASAADRKALQAFTETEAHWLDDYALYEALRRENQGKPWWQWPVPLRDSEPNALDAARTRLADVTAQVCFEQYVFSRQWQALKSYANERGILLFGDMPIFCAHDSAEVWAHRAYFTLDDDGQSTFVAGVPPDYFSATGQRWGNPLYRWDRMQADGFRWWVARLGTEFTRFDLIRLDHFRGFEAYWEIPTKEKTAVNGRWVKAPGNGLFKTLSHHFGALPLVAEDLGYITPEVRALREKYTLPGMRVLQFAFEGGVDNPYLPHNHEPYAVVYTGTHDNDTSRAWFESLSAKKQRYVLDYLGHTSEPLPWPLIRAALASVALLAMLPMQDVLLLGSGHRMNKPGTKTDNWRWRFDWQQVSSELTQKLRHLIQLYGRDG